MTTGGAQKRKRPPAWCPTAARVIHLIGYRKSEATFFGEQKRLFAPMPLIRTNSSDYSRLGMRLREGK
jgi:hypothetical protein